MRTLLEYGLATDDLPRLEREWSERILRDPFFARAFAIALTDGRRR
jgi:hypothetical protein